jgi:hypothetical protein
LTSTGTDLASTGFLSLWDNLAILWILLGLWIFGFIIPIAIYLLCAIWLYIIAKYYNVPNSWLSFIPIANCWVLCKLVWSSFMLYFWLPIIIWLILFVTIIGLLLIWIPWTRLTITWIIINYQISTKLWKWIGTTILLVLFPFIMFPYLAMNLPKKAS